MLPEQYLPLRPMLYSALTHLTMDLPRAIDITATLYIFSGISKDNAIQEIRYMIPKSCQFEEDPEDDSRLLHEFDVGIMALPLPALKRLELRVIVDSEVTVKPAASNFTGELTLESFPLLNARGVLFFTTEYF